MCKDKTFISEIGQARGVLSGTGAFPSSCKLGGDGLSSPYRFLEMFVAFFVFFFSKLN